MRVKVKMCGITRLADARAAIDLGVDALGFVFFPGSRRAVTPDQAADIISALPPFITAVGVFVDAPPDEMARTVQRAGLGCIQLHGLEAPELASRLPVPVIKAFRTSPGFLASEASRYPAAAILIDGYSSGSYGGTGTTADWVQASELARERSVILGGGLWAGNVGEAIRRVRPYGVDVSSGVEQSPGLKDPGRMAEFMAAVERAGDLPPDGRSFPF